MEFKQYPSYKKSGVEWLGGVPEHWVGSKFKYIFQEKQHTKNMNLPFGAISFGSVVYKEDKANLTDELKENYQEVLQGEFLVNPLNLNYDLKSLRTALSKIDVVVSSGYFVLKLKNNTFNKRYLEYLLYIFDIRKMKTLGAGIRQTLTFRDMAVCDVAIPSACEQTQIASFLDYETFRIDNLIAKQEKLIELLEEQRKSIISHAVTKGLNPNAPMKDSGVEWLGDVPEHWTVLKNRHIFNFSKGLSITKENLQESGIPCVSYGEVHSKFGFEFNPEINDMKFVSEEYLKTSKNCLLNSGDFIFADTSEDFEGSGNFSYLNSNSQVFAGYHTVIARLKSKQKPRFFAYIFDSNAHRKQIQTQVKGIKVFSITQGILKDIYSWLPPVHEQDLIVEYLDNECKKISLLKAKQIELIEKLKEYRSSIISHAVTGKIDVREFGA
uniref:restriction endonuclease subunit S n=1 Tax=Acinetobacter sp. TTH0-4 TaxID=1646498 RepID=UPI0018D5C552|nr:restriction endonuclease subunit S [Acinetobacter sp. TTH0-4]QPG01648.1 Type-1 restriction enzyme EcoKI specificity protein [Acinetobacter sp. TTH0-4]